MGAVTGTDGSREARAFWRPSPAERPYLLGLAALNFLTLGAWYVLRPLRDEIATLDPDLVPKLWTWVFFVMLVLSPLFGTLVGRFPRRQFLSALFGLFALAVAGFAAFFLTAEGQTRETGEAVFYVFLSVLNLFALSVLWSFAADLMRTASAARLFGPIAAAGTLGGLCGSWAVGSLRETVAPEWLLLLAAAMFELGRWVILALDSHDRRARDSASEPMAQEGGRERVGGTVFEGLMLVVRSPFLLGIVGYMSFTNAAGAVFYMQQSELLREHIPERAARGAFLADMNLWTNGLALFGQLFLNAWILRRVGPGWALLALPLVVFAALGALGYVQWQNLDGAVVLATFAVAEVVRRSANFVFSRPTREYLFTLVSRSEKYRSKNFIDTAVYRGVDVAASSAERWLRTAAGLPLHGVAFAFLPLVAAWGGLALLLGRLARRRGAV